MYLLPLNAGLVFLTSHEYSFIFVKKPSLIEENGFIFLQCFMTVGLYIGSNFSKLLLSLILSRNMSNVMQWVRLVASAAELYALIAQFNS